MKLISVTGFLYVKSSAASTSNVKSFLIVPALFEAASYINFKIPGGSFMVDYTHTFLCFRLSVPMPIALSGDALFEEMNIAAANAVTIADAYYDLLLDVSRGEAAVEDVVEFLGGSVEK